MARFTSLAMIVWAIACLARTGAVWGQCQATETAKLLPLSGQATLPTQYGTWVSISGNVAVVRASVEAADVGKLYVYRNAGAGWTQEAELMRDVSNMPDGIPDCAETNGDVIVAGWRSDDLNGPESGSAFFFRYDGRRWVYDGQVRPLDAAPGDGFGFKVAVDGDRAIIAAAAKTGPNGEPVAGAAYVFRYVNGQWVQEAKLLPNDVQVNGTFGFSVQLSGDVAAVGAYRQDGTRGALYVFRRTGLEWAQEVKLSPASLEIGDRFGQSACLRGDLLFVGSRYDDNSNGTDAGSVYVYRFNGTRWRREARLQASNGQPGDFFGNQMSVDGDVAIVGAILGDGSAFDSGTVYVLGFDGTDWVERSWLRASDGSTNDWFAHSVSMSGDTAIVGSALHGSTGAAYIYGGLSDCNDDGVLDVCQTSGGTLADCNSNGRPDICESEADCDGNGTADICDISAGAGTDCNGNGVLDACDILGGISEDCDGNGMPDECEAEYRVMSERLSPIGFGSPQSFLVDNPPLPTGGGVAIHVTARAQLQNAERNLRLSLNGVELGGLFGGLRQAADCRRDEDEIVIPADTFRSLVGPTGVALLKLEASAAVNPNQCSPMSWSEIALSYLADTDCNGNGRLDRCDIASGVSADLNTNGVPDECECTPCDTNCDGMIDAFDIEPFIELLIGSGAPCGPCSGDINGDGTIDAFDIEPFIACLVP